uniref:Uncharacterized protein n=1 Tax=Proboscia inermis TaxID=420281 RepID=A0A7S0C4C9_9STRA
MKMAKVEHNAHQMILFTERERSPKSTNNNNTPTNDRANFDKPKILTDWLAAIQQLSNEPWNSIKREKWGATSAIHDHFNDEHPNDSRNNNNPDHEDDGVDDQYGSDGNKRYKGPYKREELLSWCDRLIEAAKPFDNFMEREYFLQSSSLVNDADADDESNARTHAVKVENDDTDASEEEGEMPDNEEEEGEIQIDTLDTVRSAQSTEEEKKDGTSPVPKKEAAPRVTHDGMDLEKMMQYAKAQHWLTFIVDNEQNKGTAPPPALSFSTSEFE